MVISLIIVHNLQDHSRIVLTAMKYTSYSQFGLSKTPTLSVDGPNNQSMANSKFRLSEAPGLSMHGP